MPEPGSRVERRKQQTRSRMLHAARALLAAEGPRGLSIQAVTTAADVALGTFYNHFPGKDSLIAEIVSADDADLLGAAALLADDDAEAVRRLTAFATITVTTGLVDRQWLQLQCQMHADQRWPGATVRQQLIADVGEAAIETGTCRDRDVQLLANVVAEIVAGTLGALASRTPPLSREAALRHSISTIMAVIGHDADTIEAECGWALCVPLDLR